MSATHRVSQINAFRKSTYHHAYNPASRYSLKDNLSFPLKYRKWEQHIVHNGNFYGKTGNLISLQGEINQQIQGIQNAQLIGDYFFSDGPINVYLVEKVRCCGLTPLTVLIFSEYNSQSGAVTNSLKAINLYHPGNGDLTIPAVYFSDTNPVQFNIKKIIYNSITDQIYILYKNGNLFKGSISGGLVGPSNLNDGTSLGFATWVLETPYTDDIYFDANTGVQQVNS